MIKKVFLYSVACIVLLVALLFGYRSTLSAPINTSQLDYYFRTLEENNKAMGSVAVFKQGEQIYARSFGYADVDKSIKANLDTSYRIGSTSKTYTAVLILKAIEEGKLELAPRVRRTGSSCIKPSCIKPSCFEPGCFEPDCFAPGLSQVA